MCSIKVDETRDSEKISDYIERVISGYFRHAFLVSVYIYLFIFI